MTGFFPLQRRRLLAAPPAGGLTGYDIVATAIKSSGGGPDYNGTIAGVSAGDLLLIGIAAESNNSQTTMASWSVKVGGVDAALGVKGADSAGVMPIIALYELIAPAAGDLSLAVTANTTLRSLSAVYSKVRGYAPGAPIASSDANQQHNGDYSTLPVPVNLVPAKAGNVVWSGIALKVANGPITSLSCPGADAVTLSDFTGANAASDHHFAQAYRLATDLSPITGNWTWSPAQRAAAAFLEINAA